METSTNDKVLVIERDDFGYYEYRLTCPDYPSNVALGLLNRTNTQLVGYTNTCRGILTVKMIMSRLNLFPRCRYFRAAKDMSNPYILLVHGELEDNEHIINFINELECSFIKGSSRSYLQRVIWPTHKDSVTAIHISEEWLDYVIRLSILLVLIKIMKADTQFKADLNSSLLTYCIDMDDYLYRKIDNKVSKFTLKTLCKLLSNSSDYQVSTENLYHDVAHSGDPYTLLEKYGLFNTFLDIDTI